MLTMPTMPTMPTVTFEIRELWLGTEEEYVAARRHVRRLAGAWARALRRVSSY